MRGSPDIVIEVLAPSNTSDETKERERICLENGALEFWAVDAKRREVKISTAEGGSSTWRSDRQIPQPLLGAGFHAVDSFF